MLHRGLKVADDSIEDIGQIHSGWALGHAQDKKIRPGIPHQGHLWIVTKKKRKKKLVSNLILKMFNQLNLAYFDTIYKK